MGHERVRPKAAVQVCAVKRAEQLVFVNVKAKEGDRQQVFSAGIVLRMMGLETMAQEVFFFDTWVMAMEVCPQLLLQMILCMLCR